MFSTFLISLLHFFLLSDPEKPQHWGFLLFSPLYLHSLSWKPSANGFFLFSTLPPSLLGHFWLNGLSKLLIWYFHTCCLKFLQTLSHCFVIWILCTHPVLQVSACLCVPCLSNHAALHSSIYLNVSVNVCHLKSIIWSSNANLLGSIS